MATNWSSPKTNYFAALNDLHKALAYGYSARLVKMYNEECEYPIKVEQKKLTFRSYESTGATLRTRSEILADRSMSDKEKEITLNYIGCFGDEDAVTKYYETGELSIDNFLGIGRSHLVKVTDLIEFHERLGKPSDKQRIDKLKRKFITLEDAEERSWYDTIRLKRNVDRYMVKHFKHKVWVVELVDKSETVKVPFMLKIMNVIYAPLKYIPKHSVLQMKEYSVHTFRVGGVVNGYSVEIHIPKKFSFN